MKCSRSNTRAERSKVQESRAVAEHVSPNQKENSGTFEYPLYSHPAIPDLETAPSHLSGSDTSPIQRKIELKDVNKTYDWKFIHRVYIKDIETKLMRDTGATREVIEGLLYKYDQDDKSFANARSLVDLFKEELMQSILTDSYWKHKLKEEKGGDKAYVSTLDPKYWNNYPKGSSRSVDDILTNIGSTLLDQLKKEGKKSEGKLKLYRSMDNSEANAILEWFEFQKVKTEGYVKSKEKKDEKVFKDKDADIGIIPIKGHLGDYEQAKGYKSDKNTMLEFTLKAGAHQLLFNPEHMALNPKGKGAHASMAEYENLTSGKTFPGASKGEGNLPGYVGLKPESKGDFSLTMGTSAATHLLFQLFIQKVQKVD
ncbi:MAG: hypothetical protein FH748_03575 [Balneolaceae bacterium]|nr:hypothetical protein [Balneolaceae bacterium]